VQTSHPAKAVSPETNAMSTVLQESRPKLMFPSGPPGIRVKVLGEHVGRHKTLALLFCLAASLLA